MSFCLTNWITDDIFLAWNGTNFNAFNRANKTGKDYSKCQKCPLVQK